MSNSWEEISSWYDALVGEKGHYYHKNVILPNLLKLCHFDKKSVLDLACGQGILSRYLPKTCSYLGLEISPSLVNSAMNKNNNSLHNFVVADITLPLPVEKKDFDYATIILALQGIENPLSVLKNA